ncbi:MAG: HAD family phosphatase [Muribaculaceae bacterium]|nr:HAD family phosphatase [Muribaculaceae bacterium]
MEETENVLNIAGIDNIVFDLGGVIIDLSRESAVEAYRDLGLANADELLGLYRQEEPFLGLETGRITESEFFDTMRPLCNGADDVTMARAFSRFLVGIPVGRLQRLRKLREKGFRLYVLSNTNPVMYNGWIAEAFRQEGLSLNDYFDGIVVSFQELTCKPDPELFKRVLTRYGLQGRRTLMLDDSAANCEGARKAGMLAWQVGNVSDDDMLAITENLIHSKNNTIRRLQDNE